MAIDKERLNVAERTDLNQFLDSTLYPALFQRLDTAFPEFGWKMVGGNWVATQWPSTFPEQANRKAPDRLMVYANAPWWVKVHGHNGVRFLNLVNGNRQPAGAEFPNAVRKLCGLAGIPYPEDPWAHSPQQIEKTRRLVARRSVLDDFLRLCRDYLATSHGAAARAYLIEDKKRSLTHAEIETMGLGLCPPLEERRRALQAAGHDPKAFEDSSAFWGGLDGYITIPWNDENGNPLTVYGRWPTDTPPLMKDASAHWRRRRDELKEAGTGPTEAWQEPQCPKTAALPGPGTKSVPLFFDRALAAGHREIIIVEGVFDALLLQARGDSRVVASVAAQLNGEQVKALVRARISRAYVCGDPDRGGDAGTRNNVKALNEAGISALIVPRLPDGMDADEFLLARGIEAWRDWVGRAIHALTFRAQDILNRYRPAGGWTDGQVENVLREAYVIDDKAPPENAPQLDQFFWKPIREELGLSLEAIALRRGALHAKQAQAEQENRTRRIIEQASAKVAEGDVEEAQRLLLKGADDLREIEHARPAQPVRNLADEITEGTQRLEHYRGREFIGLPQRTLPQFDHMTMGLRGFMLLAAAPNVGKTALAVQLGLDVVANNSDASFLCLSMEMDRWALQTRLRCALSGLDWRTLVMGSGPRRSGNEASWSPDELAAIRNAEKRLRGLGQKIRILDSGNCPSPDVSSVMDHVRSLREQTGSRRVFVVVDYLQRWPLREERKALSDLEADKQRIQMALDLRDAMQDEDPDAALLVISEARKPAGGSGAWGGALQDVMGSARGAYSPDCVILFQPIGDHDLAAGYGKKFREQNEKSELKPWAFQQRKALADHGMALANLEIVKGRDGFTRGELPVLFRFRRSQIIQRPEWAFICSEVPECRDVKAIENGPWGDDD